MIMRNAWGTRVRSLAIGAGLLVAPILFAGCSPSAGWSPPASGGSSSGSRNIVREGDGPSSQEMAELFDRAVRDLRVHIEHTQGWLDQLAKSEVISKKEPFRRHVAYGSEQLAWMRSALEGIAEQSKVASGVDPDIAVAIRRLQATQLEAAMFGWSLIEAWTDFLRLTRHVLEGGFSSDEWLLSRLFFVKDVIGPPLTALSSRDPDEVEAAALSVPDLMDKLQTEFLSIREQARAGAQNNVRLQVAMGIYNTVLMAMTMKWVPQAPPGGTAVVTAMVMGEHGVMMGRQIVVTAEWVEMMRWLIRAGVISTSAVSAAIRLKAGQTFMMQADKDLPDGVRQALGEGPEVDAMRETGKAGGGMSEKPRHHVLPREERQWFQDRGFKGENNIDKWCVELEQADHQAIHGGGNWRLGRTWPGEWNRYIMSSLRRYEAKVGRMLTAEEILKIVKSEMAHYEIPWEFVHWKWK
jgi:hypothetical protein